MGTNADAPLYDPKHFAHVPEPLRESWQTIVEHDLKQSAFPARTYLEWRTFARLAFEPWHVRDEILGSVRGESAYPPPKSLIDDAISHCCNVFSSQRVRDEIVPYLLRRKATVASHTGEYFANDIERALYLMYEPEVERRVENRARRHGISPGDQDEVRRQALLMLKNKVGIAYVAEHENHWPSLMRRGVESRIKSVSRILRRGKWSGEKAEPLHMHSLHETFTEEKENEFADIIGRIDDQSIRLLASAEAMMTLLERAKSYFSDNEYAVLHAFCKNALNGSSKNNTELAEELGMNGTKFGAFLANAAKRVRENAFLHREFSRLRDDPHEGHGRI